MIYGPKPDGTYIIEFKTAAGEALAISMPTGETAVLKHFLQGPLWPIHWPNSVQTRSNTMTNAMMAT
jgi:hypothetical protein